MIYKDSWRNIVIIMLVLANVFVWSALGTREKSNTLRVYFLDVGQGDAIFIETPSGKQMLIDGGKNKKVVSELGSAMPFGDKTIDAILVTHPDADHIGGLPEVLDRYDVDFFITPDVSSGSALEDELDLRVREEGVEKLAARKGQVIDFGDGAKLIILFPDRSVSDLQTNDASVVAKLVYGESSFLFTGDAGMKTEQILLGNSRDLLVSDVLKVGHHGSRTSTSPSFAEALAAAYAVISAGKDNSYGHPHPEVLNTLEKYEIETLSTAESGMIMFVTDGEKIEIKR